MYGIFDSKSLRKSDFFLGEQIKLSEMLVRIGI
jgi:hypothetical protein